MLEEVKLDSSLDSRLDLIIKRFQTVREITEQLCEPLEIEDFNLQAIAETSPVKWHLAHTTWFFETFILKRYEDNFRAINSRYEYLFNSYYNAVGEQFQRSNRHLLSRPTVQEVFEYREVITRRVLDLLSGNKNINEILPLVVLGINHEQQHQELLLTDLKYNLYQNPLLPTYQKSAATIKVDEKVKAAPDINWVQFSRGLTDIGRELGDGVDADFAFDNESPEHKHYLEAFELSDRLVTNGDFMEFIESGGYEQSNYWLSDGWAAKNTAGWETPLYWYKEGGEWRCFTLKGSSLIDPNEPVSHLSYYEADAYATWAGARLPTEQEWEVAAKRSKVLGNFLGQKAANRSALEPLELGALAPESLASSLLKENDAMSVKQLFGDVWEWTSSSYSAYPGYKPLSGAVGEYNGKFMANQFVLRGGSCVTSESHIRATYRNFFYPEARWQFSGFRLARSL